MINVYKKPNQINLSGNAYKYLKDIVNEHMILTNNKKDECTEVRNEIIKEFELNES